MILSPDHLDRVQGFLEAVRECTIDTEPIFLARAIDLLESLVPHSPATQTDRLADIHYRLDVISEELSDIVNAERDYRRASSLSRIQDGVTQSIDRIHEFQGGESE